MEIWCVPASSSSFSIVINCQPLVPSPLRMRNGLGTSGWQLITMEKLELEAGTHQISIGVREDGLGLDKICLSTFFLAPEELGPPASNRCLP